MSERRAVERVKIAAAVSCSVGARHELAMAYDISTDGCLLQTAKGFLHPGDAVGLQFEDGVAVTGRVAWSQHRNAGVQFISPMLEKDVGGVVSASHLRAEAMEYGIAVTKARGGWLDALPNGQRRLLNRLYYAGCGMLLIGCVAQMLLRR